MTDNEIRAGEAERILNEPLVKEALARIRADAHTAWLSTTATDKEQIEHRETIWKHAKVAEKFEAILRGYMQGAKVDAFNRQQGLMEKALRIIR